jgi:hypothetical protein
MPARPGQSVPVAPVQPTTLPPFPAHALEDLTPEHGRLRAAAARATEGNWQRWGPYLAERQWGTVREDYSPDGEAWGYFSYEHSLARAYRWGEDGLLGWTDRQCRLCFALALWNERDPHLKERLFGLTNSEGNHGEDVKEAYFYLESTPTHSLARALYKYPHAEFPYAQLRAESRARTRQQTEPELEDTGIFADGRYHDVEIGYAKAGPDDTCIEIIVTNRGPAPARLHVLPTLWFRNTWSWGCTHEGCEVKPRLWADPNVAGRVLAEHPSLGRMVFDVAPVAPGEAPPTLLFTENETNATRLFGPSAPNTSVHTKDGFHAAVVHGQTQAVNPRQIGTKAAAHHVLALAPGERRVLRARLWAPPAGAESAPPRPDFATHAALFTRRAAESAQYFAAVCRLDRASPDRAARAAVARQAYAGLLWSKQFYHYVVPDWLDGDPDQPRPPAGRGAVRNGDWRHFFARDVLSMPDKWEYPWFAAWDLAFHMLPMARVDPAFAKAQLNLLLREWYMHPSGQMPAYEYNFADVNPPVHAWACWRVYKLTGPRGARDRAFLGRVFQKLLVNFTWWVNRKDPSGRHLFAGGFLGLDNIGVFDRSKPLPTGGHLEQADGTAWMAFYCGTMLAMALELAETDPAYEDIASKFFEHFIMIADAMNNVGGTGLWHEEDGFYYDQLLDPHGQATPLRLRSMVGLIPLFAVEFIDEARLDALPGFAKRTRWFLKHRRDLAGQITYLADSGACAGRHLLAIPSKERLARMLRHVFAEADFLSPYGVRSLSKRYADQPFVLNAGGQRHEVRYVPGDSDTWLFGGNSNWRGPVWFPVNYLLIEALERYHHFYGNTFKVEVPTGSGRWLTLGEAAAELSRRLRSLFLPQAGAGGVRPALGPRPPAWAHDARDRDLVLFHEFFHGDSGQGLGASHQTGWTALVTELL